MCQMVDSEVKLEAVFADAGGGKHYTRIAPESYLATSILYEEHHIMSLHQDIESFMHKLFTSFLDGDQGGHVHLHKS